MSQDVVLKKIPGLCPVCHKPNTPILLSQNANTLGTPCDSCLKKIMDSHLARIVCRNCGNTVVALAQPGTCPNGFEIKPDAIYHNPRCKLCDPTYLRYDEFEEMQEYQKKQEKQNEQ